MSKFTTELRYIIDTLGIGSTREEKIATAADEIFADYWTTEDPAYKKALEIKILRHYYMREIGAETYALWKLQINTELAEIMPKYNTLYKNLQKYADNLAGNVDVTEKQTLTNQQKSTAETTNKNGTSSTGSTTASNTGKSTNKGTGSSDAWQEYNETPQGSLQNIANGKYLTNATRNRAENSSTTDASNSAESTSSNTSTSTTDSSGSSTAAANTTEDYIKTITGKNSGTDFIDVYLKLVQGYNDIDSMIIQDLNSCFINLWE